AAVRTGRAPLRIGRRARVADAHVAGRSNGPVATAHDREEQLLRSETDAVAILELHLAVDRARVDLHSVSALEIRDERLVVSDRDARMTAGDQRIFDRDVALGATPEDDLGTHEVEFLEKEPKSKPRQ